MDIVLPNEDGAMWEEVLAEGIETEAYARLERLQEKQQEARSILEDFEDTFYEYDVPWEIYRAHQRICGLMDDFLWMMEDYLDRMDQVKEEKMAEAKEEEDSLIREWEAVFYGSLM